MTQPELFDNPDKDILIWLEMTLYAVDLKDESFTPKKLAPIILDKVKSYHAQASKTERGGEVKSAEEIMGRHILADKGHFEWDVLSAMREYARQERDRALDWAANNVSMQVLQVLGSKRYGIDRDSILSGKTNPDLEI